MKKIILIPAIIISGLVVVSCDTETVEEISPVVQKANFQKRNIEQNVSLDYNTLSEGPGDEVVPVKPPKRS